MYKLTKLTSTNTKDLLNLEEKMYWYTGKWKKLWDTGLKNKFEKFIEDYIVNFPAGCFGLVKNKKIVGALFLTTLSDLKALPYLHRFSQYYIKNGKIAYVSFFVLEKNFLEKKVAFYLYINALSLAKKWGCNLLITLIFISHSIVEEEVAKKLKFIRKNKTYKWEIYPDNFVDSIIYSYKLIR